MLPYIVRRVLVAIPLILISTFLVFVMVVQFGGQPQKISDLRFRNPPVPATTIQNEVHRLKADKPLLPRYADWLGGVVHGDFGPSADIKDVGHELRIRMLTTFRLVLLAMVLALLLAVVVGVVSAVRQYSLTDYTFTFTGFLLLSLPVFWFAILLKEFLAVDVNKAVGRHLLDTIGAETPNFNGGFWATIGDYASHLILPTIVLAVTSFAAWSRFQRAAMLEVLGSDYVRLARAKGLRQGVVMRRHALRTALIPLVTVVAIDFAGFLSGTVITERVFQWRGMGTLLVDAVGRRDIYVLLAWLLIAAVLVILFNLIADILYAYLDPRIRYD